MILKEEYQVTQVTLYYCKTREMYLVGFKRQSKDGRSAPNHPLQFSTALEAANEAFLRAVAHKVELVNLLSETVSDNTVVELVAIKEDGHIRNVCTQRDVVPSYYQMVLVRPERLEPETMRYRGVDEVEAAALKLTSLFQGKLTIRNKLPTARALDYI